MLHDFVTRHREAILDKTKRRVGTRPPSAAASDLEGGVLLFLTQLSDTLRWETTATPLSADVIGNAAARHGRELLSLGFTPSQVVHDYGDICQAVTELAVELNTPITTEEFHTLNRCLDTAIAEAVSEHARITAVSTSSAEVERLGRLAHDMRDQLNTAILAFHALQQGGSAVRGKTATVLGGSLINLRNLVDSTLSDIRMTANQHQRERVAVSSLVDDIATAGHLHAEYRGMRFAIEPVDPELAIHADPQLFASAITNLLNNAFKYTRSGGLVVLRTDHADGVLRIEVEDECGGIPDSHGDPFQPFGERRGNDRTGLGLGLAIARRAIRAHRGDIHIRNIPGKGCVFVIEVPLASEEAPVVDVVAH